MADRLFSTALRDSPGSESRSSVSAARGRSLPLLLAITCCLHACDEPRPPPRREPPARPSVPLSLNVDTAAPAPDRPRWSPRQETLEAIAITKNVIWRHEPQPHAPQRMTFFAHNLAVLTDDAVTAFPLQFERRRSSCTANRVAIEQPREVTSLADQMLFVVGAKESLLLDSNCTTKWQFPKVSYLPGSRLLAEPRWPRAFAIYDSPSGTLSRFRWQEMPKSMSGFFLPVTTIGDAQLKGGSCALMRDGSLACVTGEQLFVGWPGYQTRPLGSVAAGAPIVRLLPAERADHVRVIRNDSQFEEYWLTPKLPRMRAFPLPSVALHVVAGSDYIAVLQTEMLDDGATDLRLIALEPDGTLRWSLPVGRVPRNLTEQQRHREFFDCLSIVAHPVRPYLALRNCSRVDVFDARTGLALQRIDLPAP